jgi:Flp pilus assembly protein TadD
MEALSHSKSQKESKWSSERRFFVNRVPLVFFLTLCFLVFGTYSGIIQGDFIWDDRDCITSNPLIKAADGLKKIWLSKESIDYWPVSYSLYWTEWRLWGLDAKGYHVVNLCLHIATCLVVWRVLKKIQIKTATAVTIFFAVHPVCVEAVAWIVQAKTLLAALFGFLSLYVYILAREQKKRRGLYAAALGLFGLSLLSKQSMIFLPFFIALWEWRTPGRIGRGKALPLAGFFLLSLVVGVLGLTWYSYHTLPTAEAISRLSTIQKVLAVGMRWWAYVGKALGPVDLMFIYPSWDIDPSRWLHWLPTIALLALTILALYVLLRRLPIEPSTLSPPPALVTRLGMSWMFALTALLPVLGLVDIYFLRYSPTADHWQYAALPAILSFALESIWAPWEKSLSKSEFRIRYRQTAKLLGTCLTLVIGGYLAHSSYVSSQRFRDEETLWKATIHANPKAWLAYNNLATLYAAKHQNTEAEALYRHALALKPDYPNALQGLAMIRLHSGREGEALELLNEAIKFNPQSSPIEGALCGVLARIHRLSEAIRHCESAIKLDFRNTVATSNLVTINLMAGRIGDARTVADYAASLMPQDPERQYDLGRVLLRSGDLTRAQEVLEKALSLDPRSALVQEGLGELWLKRGDPTRAIPHLVIAVDSSSQTIHGRMLLVEARFKAGDHSGARRDLDEALRFFPYEASLRGLWERLSAVPSP